MTWTPARLLRPTGRNSFAVLLMLVTDEDNQDNQQQPPPLCVCEIHCSVIDAGDRRDLNDAVRKRLPRRAGLLADDNYSQDGGVAVDVCLGTYSLTARAWTHCVLRFPSHFVVGDT
jgi:hypothetical protein